MIQSNDMLNLRKDLNIAIIGSRGFKDYFTLDKVMKNLKNVFFFPKKQ